MSYYIGLSVLSNAPEVKQPLQKKQMKLASAVEVRRILSQFENRDITENDITREEQGRPFFPGRQVDFNVSHSGSIVAVSYAGGKNLRTGCDIELVRQRAFSEQTAKEYFSAEENEYLSAGGKFDRTRFFEIWTLKESYIKLKGLSVFDMKLVPSFIKEGKFKFCAFNPMSFRLFELSGEKWGRYILSAVIEGERSVPEIRWFSPVSLTVDRVIDMN